MFDFYEHLKSKKLTAGTMCHADWEEIGWYNQLDSAATWEIYKRFKDVVKSYSDTWGQFFWGYHREDTCNLIELEVEALGHGLILDLDNLASYSNLLDKEIEEAYTAFMNDERIKKGLDLFQQNMIQQHLEVKPRLKVNKDGSYNKTSVKSLDNWEIRLKELKENLEFNINSTDQIKWLFCNVFEVLQCGKKFEVYTK